MFVSFVTHSINQHSTVVYFFSDIRYFVSTEGVRVFQSKYAQKVLNSSTFEYFLSNYMYKICILHVLLDIYDEKLFQKKICPAYNFLKRVVQSSG